MLCKLQVVRKILIFGNSGAGKSTLARKLANEHRLAHLDLDTLAWEPTSPPRRRSLGSSSDAIARFVEQNRSWVIEGCYADLLELVARDCTEMIFLNPGVDACIKNCRARPWEPHKYASKSAQDENLEMLVEWVREYETRNDEFSLRSHRRLFDFFSGLKREYDTVA
jgi:adenylate kinase family enzyme